MGVPVYIFALIWGFLVTPGVPMPLWARAVVSALMALVTVGGFVWAKQTFLGFFKHRRKKRALQLSETERRMLYLSVGYFLQDTAMILLFEWDVMFLVHHVAGIAIFLTSILFDCAGVAPCIALFWGEMTNALLSIWWIARKSKNGPLSDVVSPVFTVAFLVIRLFVVPVYIFALIWGFLATPGVPMPLWARAVVSALMALVTVGGFVWAKQTFLGFFKHRRKKRALQQKKGE